MSDITPNDSAFCLVGLFMADRFGTINYEVVSAILSRVPRVS